LACIPRRRAQHLTQVRTAVKGVVQYRFEEGHTTVYAHESRLSYAQILRCCFFAEVGTGRYCSCAQLSRVVLLPGRPYNSSRTTEISAQISRQNSGLIFVFFGTFFEVDSRHKLRDKYCVFVC
jgi:hypothetical protein